MKITASSRAAEVMFEYRVCCFLSACIWALCSEVGLPLNCAPRAAMDFIARPIRMPVMKPMMANPAPIPNPRPAPDLIHADVKPLESIQNKITPARTVKPAAADILMLNFKFCIKWLMNF